MEAKPLQVVPSSDDIAEEGGGPQKKIMQGSEEKRVLVKEEDSGINLGLGVGAYSAEAISPVIPREKRPLFTEAQRRELEHQAFVFKHFVYSLPVPHHFVLPILKSVAATSESGFAGVCKQFPSLIGLSHKAFDYGNMLDHEPHRCRRTDGKKWRCKDKVVPSQKYCDRHIHRGRNRSRKHVEASEVNSSSLTKPSGKFHASLNSNTESAVPALVSVANPLGIQLINTSILTPSSPCTLGTSVINGCKNSLSSAGTQTSFPPAAAASPSSTLVTVAIPTATTISRTTSIASNNKGNLNFFRKDDIAKSCMRHNNIGVRSSGIGTIINDSNPSIGIGFSPRSVLQGITVPGCHHSLLIDRNNTELEPGRCRRTDGKKWRCRSAVLPDQKYCGTHMHRGAKKRFTDHEPSSIPLSSTVTIARLHSTAATPNIQRAYCTIPNTNLSMSIPASAPLVQCEEKSRSSSETDTTISDTINKYSYASFTEVVSRVEPV